MVWLRTPNFLKTAASPESSRYVDADASRMAPTVMPEAPIRRRLTGLPPAVRVVPRVSATMPARASTAARTRRIMAGGAPLLGGGGQSPARALRFPDRPDRLPDLGGAHPSCSPARSCGDGR